MALSQNGFSFFSAKHGNVGQVQPADLPIVTAQFFGVNGETHVIGKPYGRVIGCEIVMDGYDTEADLLNDLDTLSGKIGVLTGTLTQTTGSTCNFPKATFLPFEILQIDQQGNTRFLDGSGQNGWVAFVRLFWRQRTLT